MITSNGDHVEASPLLVIMQAAGALAWLEGSGRSVPSVP
jgi:hypothetical protein